MISFNKINFLYIKQNCLPILTERNKKIILFVLSIFSIFAACYYLFDAYYSKKRKFIPISPNPTQIPKTSLELPLPRFLDTQVADDLGHQAQTQNPALIQAQGSIFNKNIPKAIEILIYSFLNPKSICHFAWVNQASHNISREPQIIANQLNNTLELQYIILEKIGSNSEKIKQFWSEFRSKFVKLAKNPKIGRLLTKIPYDRITSEQDITDLISCCDNIQEVDLRDTGHPKYWLYQLNKIKGLKKLKLGVGPYDHTALDYIPSHLESLSLDGIVIPMRLSTTFQRLNNLKELRVHLGRENLHEYLAYLSGLEFLDGEIRVCTNQRLIEICDGLKNLKKCSVDFYLEEDWESETLQHLPSCLERIDLNRSKNLSIEGFKNLFSRINLREISLCCNEIQPEVLSYLSNSLEYIKLNHLNNFDLTFLKLEKLMKLKRLDIFYSSDFDQSLIQLFRHGVNNLKELHICNCSFSKYNFFKYTEGIMKLYLYECTELSNLIFSSLPRSLLHIAIWGLPKLDYVKNYKQIRKQRPNVKIYLTKEDFHPDLAEMEARGESISEIPDNFR